MAGFYDPAGDAAWADYEADRYIDEQLEREQYGYGPDEPPEYPCGDTNEHAPHKFRPRAGGYAWCDGAPFDPDEFDREPGDNGLDELEAFERGRYGG